MKTVAAEGGGISRDEDAVECAVEHHRPWSKRIMAVPEELMNSESVFA
jgi:hypothetical protein